MSCLKVICSALIFIFKLRFPPGVSIATKSVVLPPHPAAEVISIQDKESAGSDVIRWGMLEHMLEQSRTQSNACVRARMALALGKLNFSCAVIGLTFVNRGCRQRTGTPKFRGSGC
jgi:hypothetical protein